jgi:glycine/D-amino acid oxidase-like deaminating enzyme
LSQGGVDYVRRTIAESKMQGIDQTEGWLHVSKTDRPRQAADEADLLRSLGADIEVWPERLVRSKLKSDRYFQAINYPTAINIHPLNYAFGLAKLAEDAGARIFEQTRALSIDPAGVRKRILTANGRIRAAHIVLAGNVHLDGLMPDIAQTLMPVHTFVIVTKPLGAALPEAIAYRGSVSDTDWADSHYRIVGGDRLMWCGRMTVWDANPRWFGRKLRRDLRRRFPQLQGAEIDYAWTGTLGLSVHRMPQIGELSPGVWLASGFGGHGLNTTAMAGDLITRAIVEGDDRWRLFQPFELVWAGGRAGRIVLQTAYWGQLKYEAWASSRSRGNEVKRIRADARAKNAAAAVAVVMQEQQAEPAGADRPNDSRLALRLRKWRDRN